MTVQRKPVPRKPTPVAPPSDILFFEMAGQPGIMYLDSYSFGGTAPWGKWSDEEGISISGHASSTYLTERVGPLHLFPAWKSLFHSPLCNILREAGSNNVKLPSCTIGKESPTKRGTFLKTTQYKLIDPVVDRYYHVKEYGREACTVSYRDIVVFPRS